MSEANKIQTVFPFEDKRKFKPQNFIHTSLFSEVYVFNDLPTQFKNIWDRLDDNGRFDEFYDHLLTLMSSFTPSQAHKWTHSETLTNLIFPILEILGYGDYSAKNNSYLSNHSISLIGEDGSQIDFKPSVLICEDEAGKNFIKNASKSNVKAEMKKYLKLPLITGYYGSSLDRKSGKYDLKKDEVGRRGDVFTNLGPNDQMSQYLNILGLSWGIFTDGAIWRLYRKEASSIDSEKCYEFDFSELYNLYRTSESNAHDEQSEFFEIAKYMYWFFSYSSIVKGPEVIPFIESVYQSSQIYVSNIENDLKERFVHAMTIACNGYLKSVRSKNSVPDIRLITKTSESLIFNLIFIRSCESRRVLPIHQDYWHISLKAVIEKIKHFSYSDNYDASAKLVKMSLKDIFQKIITDDGFDLYDYIKRLHLTVENGNNGFGIEGFVESVFYPEERAFYNKHKITNYEMIKLLYQLFYNFNGVRNIQIPYNLITPRQLGSVYESFLEFQPHITDKKMYYVKKKKKENVYWQWVDDSKINPEDRFQAAKVEKNGMIFSPNNKERKTTGSFYTPEYIVNSIVKEALDNRTKDEMSEDVLSLKVCDPAMGSGHFLLGVVDYLSKKILEKGSGLTLSEAKRAVLHSCIYGVDINPSAVKLAKMSLWLGTALPGIKLEKLDDQLKVTNSLIDEKLWTKSSSGVGAGFDVVIGNPPYIETKLIPDHEKAIIYGKYETMTEKANYYVCFFELAKKIMKNNQSSVLAFVCPPDWMDPQKSYKNFKSFVTENLSFLKIVTLDKDAFPVPTKVFLFKNKKQSANKVQMSKLVHDKKTGRSAIVDDGVRVVNDFMSCEAFSMKVGSKIPTIKIGQCLNIELGISLSKESMANSLGKQSFLKEGVSQIMQLEDASVRNCFSYQKAESMKGGNDRLRSRELFSGEKIIIKRRPYTAIFSDNEVFCKSNCFILKNKKNGKYDIKWLALLFNSSFFKNMIQEKFEKAQIGKDFFNDLEIPYSPKAGFEVFFKKVLKEKNYEKKVEMIDHYLSYLLG